jgi:membrane protein involved in colicin uptake
MTPEYKARREAKHAAQAAARTTVGDSDLGTIDLTPRCPSLGFLQGKQFRQGNGGRKNASGHGPEHEQANRDIELY